MHSDIVIVGRGRLGRSLALLLEQRDCPATLIGREPIPTGADAVLLAVPDTAVSAVARTIPPGPVVLHCSGALPVDVLHPHRPAGSFHPLMTFPGPEVALPDLRGVPAALDGDAEALAVGEELARALDMLPLPVPGDRRLYHAAAVMAGNFATVLLADASTVLEAAGVPAEQAAGALLPLALASLRNAVPDPARALTGPAARGDHATISAHLDALASGALHREEALYRALSDRALELARRCADKNDTP